MAIEEDDFDQSYLLELYEILLGYVPERERANLAEHVFDWLRGIEAPDWVFDGLAAQDKHLEELCEGRTSFDGAKEIDEEVDDFDEDYDYENYDDDEYDEDDR
jgi:hypothetical protein